MELQDIAEKTHLPLRKLRYVLDHRMLPGLRVRLAEDVAGRPRYFTDFEGFAIACAATLLIGGLKREAVILCMNGLAELTWEGESHSKRQSSTEKERRKRSNSLALFSSYQDSGAAVAMLGDGENIRVQGKSDTGWRQPGSLAELGDEYRPLVVLQLDLAQLRARLKEKSAI